MGSPFCFRIISDLKILENQSGFLFEFGFAGNLFPAARHAIFRIRRKGILSATGFKMVDSLHIGGKWRSPFLINAYSYRAIVLARRTLMPVCNICGSDSFVDMGARKAVKCALCESLERTRIMGLLLKKHGVPRPGMKILHLAPEKGIGMYFLKIVGQDNYHARDLDPSRYTFCNAKQFNLCTDAEQLPDNYYDLIVHSHVIEHVPCNYSAVLLHLHRALSPEGLQMCGIPVSSGFYEETCGPLSQEERTRKFGQFDHIRRFGDQDVQLSLGMIFKIPPVYDLATMFSADELNQYNIPENARTGFTPHSVFVFRKTDAKISV
jgi:ubiquinone/menaquinone biosynthesis C-methylase UbiE